MSQSYITRAQLIAAYPVPKSRPGLRNWIKKLGFPAPTYANPNCPIFKDEQVAEWFENRPRNHHDAIAELRSA
jgi:hypothetical protein